MKVGIYSGSFDPIHDGHLNFALSSIENNKLNKVFFMPEPRPRRKQGVKAFEHRTNMIKLAIKDNPKLGVIVLDQKQFQVAETLPILVERFKGAELFMLMGDDNLDHLMHWPDIEGLISKITFIIASRKYSIRHIEEVIKNINTTKNLKIKYKLIQGNNPELSSRIIRNNIKKEKDFKGLNKLVTYYILSNNLYSTLEK